MYAAGFYASSDWRAVQDGFKSTQGNKLRAQAFLEGYKCHLAATLVGWFQTVYCSYISMMTLYYRYISVITLYYRYISMMTLHCRYISMITVYYRYISVITLYYIY